MFADNDGSGAQNGLEPTDTVDQVVVAGPLTSRAARRPKPTRSEPTTPLQRRSGTQTATRSRGSASPSRCRVSILRLLLRLRRRPVQALERERRGELHLTGSTAGQDTITAYADGNANGYPYDGDVSDSATKTWEVVDDATAITLNADFLAKVTTGTERCVTATATTGSGDEWGNRPVGFTVSGTNSDSQITNTNSNGQVQFCYTPASAGTDTLTVFADNDGSGAQNGLEPTDTVDQVVVAGPLTITLLPETETNEVGTNHTVTATVRDANGDPVEGIGVTFTISGVNFCEYFYGCGDGQYKLSNASGEASFTSRAPRPARTRSRLRRRECQRLSLRRRRVRLGDEDLGSRRRRHRDHAQPIPRQGHDRHRALRYRHGDDGLRRRMGQPPGRLHGERHQQRQSDHQHEQQRPGPVLLHPRQRRHRHPDGVRRQRWKRGAERARADRHSRSGGGRGTIDDHAAAGDETNEVGTNHTVTATVRDANGGPVEGIGVTFTISGVNFCEYFYGCGDGQYKPRTRAARRASPTRAPRPARTRSTPMPTGMPTAILRRRRVRLGDEGLDGDSTGLADTRPGAPSTTVTGVELCETATVRSGGNLVAAGFAVEFTSWRKRPHGDRDHQRERSGPALLRRLDCRQRHDQRVRRQRQRRFPGPGRARRRQRHEAVAGQPPNLLTLEPPTANYPLNTTQTHTATVTDGGSPVARVEVIFNI